MAIKSWQQETWKGTFYYISWPVYFFDWIKEHPFKKHKCKLKMDELTYLKSSAITKYGDDKNKPSLYP